MEDKKESNQVTGSSENDSLEAQPTVIESGSSPTNNTNPDDAGSLTGDPNKDVPEVIVGKPKKQGPIKWIVKHLNIYFLAFLLLLAVAGSAVFATYLANKKATNDNSTKSQKLSDEELKALQNSTTTVGDPKSVLNVESNAVFAGKVLVRDSLDVAGTIKVGGALSLPGISVSGTSTFDEVKLNNLNISGNAAVLGQLTVQKTLTVSGGATFGGTISAPQLNIDALQINKDLVLNRHITVGGVTPTFSYGGALGSGGTTSVSGSDTAGTVNINIGGAPPTSGCFITVNFNQKFNSTPHMAVTPVGSGASQLNYYVTRTTGSFSICYTTSPAPTGSFSFDYIVFD